MIVLCLFIGYQPRIWPINQFNPKGYQYWKCTILIYYISQDKNRNRIISCHHIDITNCIYMIVTPFYEMFA